MLGRVDHAPGHLVEKGGQGGDLGLGLVGLAVAGSQDGKRLGKPTLIKILRRGQEVGEFRADFVGPRRLRGGRQRFHGRPADRRQGGCHARIGIRLAGRRR